jgi:hypothetical protein
MMSVRFSFLGASTMRTILNKTPRPLKVRLPQGKVLHLGPFKEGRVSPQALESPGIKKLVEAGDLEVMGSESRAGSASRGSGHAATDTHGHHPSTSVRSRGDR